MVQENGKVHLETTFVSSLFKGLSNRDAAVVQEDRFFIERSKQMLTYDMVTQLHLFIIFKTHSLFLIGNAEVNFVKLII
jgi:uridine kinase